MRLIYFLSNTFANSKERHGKLIQRHTFHETLPGHRLDLRILAVIKLRADERLTVNHVVLEEPMQS